MKNIKLLNSQQILLLNQLILAEQKQSFQCLDKGKIDSALGAAYYPGFMPFKHGGIAEVAGALCLFLIKAHAFLDGNKRTAGIASTAFLALNNSKLIYPLNKKKNINAFADIIEKCATSEITKEELMLWYQAHKSD